MCKVYDFQAKKFIRVSLNDNRGFLYGDGFFETIKVSKKEPLNIDYHYLRIELGFNKFQFNLSFTCEELKCTIGDFLKNQDTNGRLKLVFFRKSGGLYVPNSTNSLMFIDFKPINTTSNSFNLKPAFVSSKSFNDYGITSGVKPISSVNYVMAGLELKASKFEEIIITDRKGNISECLYSNIWWINNNEIFTPSLDTGCVSGVSRLIILDYLKQKGLPYHEVKEKIESITPNSFIFNSNTFGLNIISSINQISTKLEHSLFKQIRDDLYSTNMQEK